MLHLTNNKPKHLIKVKGKPFLSYLLDNLVEAGYNDIIIVAGYRGEKVKKFLENSNYPARVVNQFDLLGKNKYGTLCPLECVGHLIGKEDFLLVYGDNIYSSRDMAEFNIEDDYNYVAGFEHPNPRKYGVLVSNNGFLKEIIEKPKKPMGNLINSGLYKFTPEIFEKISSVSPSARKEYELTDAISLLANEEKVKIKKLEDYWLDFGNPADIIKFTSFYENLNSFSKKHKRSGKPLKGK